jgi:outer membrane protein assembly factor BamA
LRSKFIDPTDGWPDISGFLDSPYGFVPVIVPITEPAVGYGVGGALVFIDRPQPKSGHLARPNIAAVGGFATQNGSWGVLGGWSRWWLDDRLQTLLGVAYASVNLDYYGLGDNSLRDNPLHYTLEPVGGLAGLRYRLGDTPLMAGLQYVLADTTSTFDLGLPPSDLIQPGELDSRVGGLIPSLIYDTRNNIFTPTHGLYAEVSVGVFSNALGGDFDYQNVGVTAVYYLPLHPSLTLGVKADGSFSFGDAPFYVRPFIYLRGTPAKRYEGEHVAQIEVEARWQFWKRMSLVGFTGGGVAWNDFERLAQQTGVVTGGVGVRYELARKYGLHMGLDVAFGPAEPAIYVQFGSAWFRP